MSRNKRVITDTLLEQALTDAAARMTNDGGVQMFIDDVLTKRERQTIGRRILIARLLLEGYTAAGIAELMAVSPNTLSRIRRWLEEEAAYGSLPTPRNTKRQHNVGRQEKQSFGAPFSFERLRKTYPAHFLLFNIIAELRKPKS